MGLVGWLRRLLKNAAATAPPAVRASAPSLRDSRAQTALSYDQDPELENCTTWGLARCLSHRITIAIVNLTLILLMPHFGEESDQSKTSQQNEK